MEAVLDASAAGTVAQELRAYARGILDDDDMGREHLESLHSYVAQLQN